MDLGRLRRQRHPQHRAPGGQLDKTKLKDYNFKLNFQPAEQLGGPPLLDQRQAQVRPRRRPRPPARGTHDQTTPQDIYKFEDTYLASSNWSITGLWSRDNGKFTLAPEGGLEPHIFIDADGIYPRHRLRLHAGRDDRPGAARHQLLLQHRRRRPRAEVRRQLPRAGEQLGHRLAARQRSSSRRAPGPRSRHRTGRVLPQPQERIRSSYGAAWVQDTITRDRWTVNAGVRYDRQYLKNLPSFDPGNPEAAGPAAADRLQGQPRRRLHLEHGRAAGRRHLRAGREPHRRCCAAPSRATPSSSASSRSSTRVNPVGYNYAYFYFEDANNNLVLDPGELGSLQFAYTYNIDPNNPTA